ncbi:hypothetical protein DFH06DRAFT_1351602 [Mycena polygramma]|nr:hypothetical protein DFH06DRAFT_1351602 [Mycena polygramma]
MSNPLDATYGVWIVSFFLETILYAMGLLQTRIYFAGRPTDAASSNGRSRIVDPIDQCLAHIRTPRYKDHPGKLYTVFRKMRVYDSDLRLMVDALEMKTGYAVDIVRRQEQYHDLCDPVDFIWLYEYDCDSVKLIERLVHLTLRARGGTIKPYPCPGCGTRHREFFLESAAGGVDGMCAIIEFWLGAMGQPIVRSVVQPIV